MLVSNAAFQMNRDATTDIPDEEWDRTIATNLSAFFHLAKAAVPHMPSGSSIIGSLDRVDAGAEPGGQRRVVDRIHLSLGSPTTYCRPVGPVRVHHCRSVSVQDRLLPDRQRGKAGVRAAGPDEGPSAGHRSGPARTGPRWRAARRSST